MNETTQYGFPVAPTPTAETTADFQQTRIIGRPFQKGQCGNPEGSRNRLTDSVLKAIAEVLERVRTEEPATYMKFIISLLPRELIIQFEQHRPGEIGALDHYEIAELAEYDQTQKIAEHVYRNQPPQVARR